MSISNQATRTEIEIFQNFLNKNNNRLLITFGTILLVANLATVLIMAFNLGSEYLNYSDIILQFLICFGLLVIGKILAYLFTGRLVSAYSVITTVLISIFFFQYIIWGSTQLFTTHYIPLALSILYFNRWISFYNLICVLISQTALFMLRPELLPGGPTSNIIIRYFVYLFVGISSSFGSDAIKQLWQALQSIRAQKDSHLDAVEALLKSVQSISREMADSSARLKKTSERLEKGGENQAASVEEMSGAMEELMSSIEQVAENIRNVIENTRFSVSSSEESTQVADQAVSGMEKIKVSSAKITDFVEVINDIADQTNLLSLNASIEAARAGEAGRGFSVVANEVSKLADKSTDAASEIARLVNESMVKIDNGMTFVKDLNSMVETIRENLSKTLEIGEKVVGMTEEQISSSKLVTDVVDSVNDMSMVTAESTTEITRAVERLTEEAERLNRTVKSYEDS